MAPNELYYFVPGQVILHLEHIDMDQDVLEKAVAEFLANPNLKGFKGPWSQLTLQPDKTITFPLIKSDDGKNISLVLTKFELLDTVNAGDVYGNQDKLIDLLVQLYNDLGEGFGIYNDEIFIHYVSPNWLTSGAPHQPATGGPGSWPVPAGQPGIGHGKFSFPEMPNSGDIINASAGQDVEVAILDTAPITECYMKLEGEAVKLEWPDLGVLNNKEMYQGMYQYLRENLAIVPYKPSWGDFCFRLMGHHYLMPDHGLFVAGIIHTIAPQALLRLYEVLNPYGAGSYESIYTGLSNVLENLTQSRKNKKGYKLVINMSLVLNMPSVDFNNSSRQDDPGFTDRYIGKWKYIDLMIESIREILAQLVNLDNVLIVAAAGNDAPVLPRIFKANLPPYRPWARYPAAAPNVIGVGALSGQGVEVASYSNLCDKPQSEGCMTFGGKSGIKGVRGVFVHDFPVKQDNETKYQNNTKGWAWWAGTSFATPIISGLLAAAWKKNNWHHADDVQPFLSEASGGTKTDKGERVIRVTQA
jgi:hypothetical protein